MVLSSEMNRRTSGSLKSLNTYPSQFFDISSQYMPPSVKEMFRWCLYLYMTHSEIAPVINKKCAYVITDLIYESSDPEKNKPSDKVVDTWQELLERILKISEEEYKLLLDFEVYGNAFCSFFFPFERYLKCPSCQNEHLGRDIKWKYEAHEFRGVCAHCNAQTAFTPRDKIVKNRRRIRLIRWFPQYIDIQHNPFTGQATYIYRIPTWLKKRVSDPTQNKALVEETPLTFLTAIKQKKNIQFDPDNFYHMKNPSVSTEDDSFGIPPLLCVFKDAWLFQTYRRAQEAIAIDHILPMTLLIPTPPSGNVSPHMSTNLAEWASRMQVMISKWRRDPNAIFTVPFAATVENIRGDAKALGVQAEMEQIRQQICGGLDVPQEFIYGGLNWSGSSISLRVLENLFLARISQLDNFLRDFVVPSMQRFCSLPKIVVRHTDFKMADDVQQKQLAMNLRQTNTISDRTTIEELGFDYERELQRRKDEEDDRISQMKKQGQAQAESQGQQMIIQAKYQALAQIAGQKAAQDASMAAANDNPMTGDMPKSMTMPGQAPEQGGGAKPASGGAKPAKQSGSGGSGSKDASQPQEISPVMMDAVVNNFLKGIPDDQKESELMAMRKTNPTLAVQIQKRMKTIDNQGKSMKALPDQKPPRRKNSPV